MAAVAINTLTPDGSGHASSPMLAHVKEPERRVSNGSARAPALQAELADVLVKHNFNFVLSDPRLPDHPIVFASEGFCQMTGYRKEEVIGKNCRFLQGQDTDRGTVLEIRDAIREERACQVKVLNYTKARQPFWNLFHLAPIYSRDDGRVLHFLGVQTPLSSSSPSPSSSLPSSVPATAGGAQEEKRHLATTTTTTTTTMAMEAAAAAAIAAQTAGAAAVSPAAGPKGGAAAAGVDAAAGTGADRGASLGQGAFGAGVSGRGTADSTAAAGSGGRVGERTGEEGAAAAAAAAGEQSFSSGAGREKGSREATAVGGGGDEEGGADARRDCGVSGDGRAAAAAPAAASLSELPGEAAGDMSSTTTTTTSFRLRGGGEGGEREGTPTTHPPTRPRLPFRCRYRRINHTDASQGPEVRDHDEGRAKSAVTAVLGDLAEASRALMCQERRVALAESASRGVVCSSLLMPLVRIQQSFVLADPNLPDMPIVHASDLFLRLSGYAREEVVGRNCRFLQGPLTDPAAVRQVREAVANEKACTVTLLNYRKDGVKFWNSLHISPVRNCDGKVAFFCGVQLDISMHQDSSKEVVPGGTGMSQRMQQLGAVGAVKVAVRGLQGQGLRRSLDLPRQ